MTFFGEMEHFSGKNGALRWSILVGKQKHNVQKPTTDTQRLKLLFPVTALSSDDLQQHFEFAVNLPTASLVRLRTRSGFDRCGEGGREIVMCHVKCEQSRVASRVTW